jgi:hypothetical protein
MNASRWVQDRWFPAGIRLFAACALIALTVVGLSGVAPMVVLGQIALVAALLGVLLCATGLRLFNPLQWHGFVARASWIFTRIEGVA